MKERQHYLAVLKKRLGEIESEIRRLSIERTDVMRDLSLLGGDAVVKRQTAYDRLSAQIELCMTHGVHYRTKDVRAMIGIDYARSRVIQILGNMAEEGRVVIHGDNIRNTTYTLPNG